MSPDSAIAAPVWRRSSPSAVEDDLMILWQDAARDGPITHATMSNLVIVASGALPASARTPEPRETLVQIAARHPARVILIDHHGNRRPCEPDVMRAGLLTFGAPDHRYGVEVISLAATCADASLPSIIRSLIRGDVPTSVWFGGDLSVAPPALTMLAAADQFVYESEGWADVRGGFNTAARLLRAPRPPALVDLTWRQLSDVRSAIIAALDPDDAGATVNLTDVSIEYGAGRESSAWLIRGWLGTSLFDASDNPIAIVPAAEREIAMRVRLTTPQHVASVAHLGVRIAVRDLAGRTLDLSPMRESLADAIADSLLVLGRDTSFEEIVTSCATS